MDGRAPCEGLTPRLAVGAVLSRVHGELIDLGRCADDLQTVISAIVASSSAPLPPNVQMQLQAADALSQRLERLAQLAAALEAQAPDSWVLAHPESAGELARIFRRVEEAALRHETANDEGDCEMF